MIEAVIFDMDGVIVDSESHWAALEPIFFTNLIGKAGDISENDCNNLAGLSIFDTYEFLKKRYNISLSKNEFIEIYNNMASSVYKQCSLIPGCLDLMRSARNLGLKVSIASSSQSKWVMYIMERFVLSEFILSITCGDEVTNSKPDPEIFLLSSRKLGMSPEKCLVIEDSRNGVLAAKAAGMKCIGLQNDSKQNLREADIIVNNLNEIILQSIGG